MEFPCQKARSKFFWVYGYAPIRWIIHNQSFLLWCRPPIPEAEVTSVFVRDFADSVEAPQLLEVFKQFGPIKNGLKGINMKKQRFKEAFAFVEFETVAAMEKAIASPPTMDGKQVCKRKPTLL
jgi:RNA recognition motif-containing protein